MTAAGAVQESPAFVSSRLVGHVPGRCLKHPGQELVEHRRVGVRFYGADKPVCCPDPDHNVNDYERCRWCGGPLWPEPTRFSWRPREYCRPNHRLQAHRARVRAARS